MKYHWLRYYSILNKIMKKNWSEASVENSSSFFYTFPLSISFFFLCFFFSLPLLHIAKSFLRVPKYRVYWRWKFEANWLHFAPSMPHGVEAEYCPSFWPCLYLFYKGKAFLGLDFIWMPSGFAFSILFLLFFSPLSSKWCGICIDEYLAKIIIIAR